MPLLKKHDDAEDTLDEVLQNNARIEELLSDDDDPTFEDVESEESDDSGIPFPGKTTTKRSSKFKPASNLPPWLQKAALNLIHDDLVTTTSLAQEKVTKECLPYLTLGDTQGLPLNAFGLPALRREAHKKFLLVQLDRLPAPYAAMDASRPWLFYWTMAGLSFLGEDVSSYRDRLMDTVRPLQNSTGGFGGGHGHLSHCACTYATVLALACVGGLEVVDRKAMWEWLGRVKQADGGFCMAEGAEEDIRGAYCAATIISLLNLPLELPPDAPARRAGLKLFTDGLGEWVGRCQTYEGGVGAAPSNEAHGAYAFCALACLSILDAPHVSIPKYLDAEALAAWLAARQTRAEGGFQGRQEKLVDACYSHWVGGCWDLIQAALPGLQNSGGKGDVWNREALIRYLLTCCQSPGKKGGMRDKPSTHPDAYHTCYSIAGLSHAQNRCHYDSTGEVTDEKCGRLIAAFNWHAERPSQEEMREMKVGQEDLVGFVHPVFVVPMEVVEAAKKQFKDGGL
jgi:protein farnesyltransferase subunit beta